MMHLIRGGAAAILLSGLVTAQAAEPSSGTLTLDSGPIEFSQGPNVGANPTVDVEVLAGVAHMCVDVLLPCDSFALTIDLPDDIGSAFPSALVRMLFTSDDPSGTGSEDYDIYLFDADGNQVNDSVNAGMPESMAELAEGGVTEYRIEVAYYTALGSTYTGKIELDLGAPAPGVDPDEYLADNSVLGSLLRPNQESEARNAYTERRSAAGGLGIAGLLIIFAAAVRRRFV